MGREVKTISLDTMTAELAAKIPNFSSWVRMQLLREHIAQGGQQLHTVPDGQRGFVLFMPTEEIDSYGRRGEEQVKLDKCNPHHVNGVCPTCWPPEHSVEIHIAILLQNRIDSFNNDDLEEDGDDEKPKSAMEQWAEIQKGIYEIQGDGKK